MQLGVEGEAINEAIRPDLESAAMGATAELEVKQLRGALDSEIAQLHKDGFEVGNHTLGHTSVTDKTLRDLLALQEKLGIAPPDEPEAVAPKKAAKTAAKTAAKPAAAKKKK